MLEIIERVVELLYQQARDGEMAAGTSSSHLSSSLVVKSGAPRGRPPTSVDPKAIKKRAADRLLKQRINFFPQFFFLLLEVGAPDNDLQEIFCTAKKYQSTAILHFCKNWWKEKF
jgi:hypothetical protein